MLNPIRPLIEYLQSAVILKFTGQWTHATESTIKFDENALLRLLILSILIKLNLNTFNLKE